MNKRTIIVFSISLTYFFAVASLLACMIYLIHQQGARLDESQEAISAHAAKETAYNHVVDLLDSTKADREELETYFITEKDTITFISNLELIAKQFRVSLETTELSVTKSTEKDALTTAGILSIGLNFSGSDVDVKRFVVMLENLPYKTTIPNLSIGEDPVTGVVTGTIKLLIATKL